MATYTPNDERGDRAWAAHAHATATASAPSLCPECGCRWDDHRKPEDVDDGIPAAYAANGELVEGLRMLVEAAEAAARHHREEASGHEFPALESQITRTRAILERITH